MSAEDISLNENPETSGQKHETKDSQLELFAVSTNDNIQQGDVPQNEIDDNETSKNIIVEDFAVEMRKSYLDYARTVVADRALPDVRDGLKPVQRRVLFGMDGLGLASSGAHKKSARIVGEVMGKYHPHGDSSIYDTMVRMAQDFSLRTTLVDGQGNFGSLDGDSAAAMRYTEAKLTTTGEHLMADMRENTVDFVPNFDETLEEPSVLPSKFPNLIVNGTSGIAVGMSTSMAPHNPGETFSAIVYRLNHPDCGIDDIFKILPGPDFPTGGIVSSESLREIYSTGKGRVRIRSKTTIEETTKRKNIVVSEIPYGVNKGNLVSSIATVLRDSGADGIVAIRDESGRDGVRIVVELHKRADAAAILDMLFKKTPLETTFSVQNLALERRNGEMVPRQYDIMGLIDAFIAHRVDVVTRRTKFRLDKAEKHLHIVEGLLRAISMIQSIIDTIRNSKTIGEAKKKLTESPFDFSILQAEAILDMKLQRLVALQEKELVKEKDTLTSDIKKYGKILSDRRALNAVITGETEELRSIYNSPRRTAIVERFEIHEGTSAVSFRGKDAPVVKKGTTYVFLGEDGLLFSKCYRRGTPGAEHEAGVVTAVECPSSGNIVCITNIGGAYSCPISEIPEPNGKRGKPVSGIFGFSSEECVSLLFFVPDEIRDNPEHPASNDRIFSVLRTIQDGKTKLKSTSLSEFASWRRKTGKSICPDGCILVSVLYGQVSDNLAFLTRKEKFLSVSCNEIPVQGIGSNGVQGMKLEDGDEITKVILWSVKTTHILFLMKNGYAKKIETSENLIQGRSTKGVSVARPSRMSACVDMVPLSAEFPKNGIVVVESGWHKIADIPVSELSQSKTSLFAVPLTTPVPETQDAFSDASSEGDASDVDERNQEITPESEETPIQDEGGGD